jgi:serine/threonine-protein kinase
VKVLDFGISKSALAAAEPGGRRHAHTMLPMGTPGYMSPEQIRECGAVDARTDIWALGCVLSELLTGTSAFDAPTIPQLTASILERHPIPLRKLLPEAPPALEALIQKCLEKNADQRFQDVAELAIALYPFGPRRARVSAERCHHVLNGQQGMVIEFSSVAPPPMNSPSTPLPVSSTGAVVTPASTSLPSPEPVRTSTPATITVTAAPAPKSGRKAVTVASIALLTAAAGVLLALRPPSGAGSRPASAMAAATPPVSPVPRVVGPAVTAPSVAAEAAPPTASAGADADFTIEPTPARSAQTAKRSVAKRSAKVPAARPVPAAYPTATAPKARATVDDSEPDVGY